MSLPHVIALLTFLFLVACSPTSDDSPQVAHVTATISRGDPIPMEENEHAVLVSPLVAADPLGGYLVADGQEGQVRRYDSDGRLIWHSGRRGGGPGEYFSPVSIHRLDDRSLLVLDSRGTATRATRLAEGGEFVEDFVLPFIRIEGSVYLGANKSLVFGISADDQGDLNLLHVLDLSTKEIESSFFPVPEVGNPAVTRSMAYVQADVQGDTIAVAFAGLDSLYIYALDGRRHRAFELPVDNFRLAGDPPTDFNNPLKRVEWLTTFETISGVWWVDSDLIVIGYKTVIPGGMQWHWVATDRTGGLVHREYDTGQPLLGRPSDQSLVTVLPGNEARNVWQKVTFSR